MQDSPTGVKLQGGGDKIETLTINAAECEPYITADDRLMQDCAAQVVEGIPHSCAYSAATRNFIGIEDNKTAGDFHAARGAGGL